MKRILVLAGLLLILAQAAIAFQPTGWVYFNWPWAYAASSGEWKWFNDLDPLWVVNMNTASWSRFAGAGVTAYVAKTGQTTSSKAGDDGTHQKGVGAAVRFTDHGNGTVTDNLTGLMWVKAPHALTGNTGVYIWNNAIDFCNNLIHGGHSDWRLPNVKELRSLIDHASFNPALPSGHLFTGIYSSHYWSGTLTEGTSTYRWVVQLQFGSTDTMNISDSNRVWPVRGGL